MKIMVVSQHFYPEQFRINDICFELVKKGHEVTVLTGLPNYPKGKLYDGFSFFRKRKELYNGVKIIRTPIIVRGTSLIRMGLNYASFAIVGSIKTLFLQHDFDVVYVYQTSPVSMAFPAIAYSKIYKKPLIIHCLDQWPISVTIGPISKESLFYKFLFWLSKKTYLQADLITVGSKSFIDYFRDILNISETKKFVYWPSYAESVYAVEKKKKVDSNLNLVFAGNIGPAQDVENIVETANLLKDNKNIVFHIIGDGLNRQKCEDLKEKYKLENIKFYGYFPVSEMKQFYEIADIFLITMVSHEVVNQTIPAKVQSYMMSGKPIIGAIKGEVSRVIAEADCGLSCLPSNPVLLKENILLAHEYQDKLDLWGKNSLSYYQKYFNKDILLDNLIELFYNEISNYKGEKINANKIKD